MSQPGKDSAPLPGKGLFGWIGRQIGHVRHAMKTEVSDSKTIYRDCKIEEQPLPQDPNVKLRRTTIDEVVVEKNPASRTGQ